MPFLLSKSKIFQTKTIIITDPYLSVRSYNFHNQAEMLEWTIEV